VKNTGAAPVISFCLAESNGICDVIRVTLRSVHVSVCIYRERVLTVGRTHLKIQLAIETLIVSFVKYQDRISIAQLFPVLLRKKLEVAEVDRYNTTFAWIPCVLYFPHRTTTDFACSFKFN
jgi:hypothetical protein